MVTRTFVEKAAWGLLIAVLCLSVLGLKSDATNKSKIASLRQSGPVFEVKSEKITHQNLEKCLSTAKTTLKKFGKFTGSLNKVTIHGDTTLRRGLSNANVMYLRCLSDQAEFENVIIHEIGHVVDLGYLVAKNTSYKSKFNDFGAPVYMDDKSVGFYNLSWIDNTALGRGIKPADFVSIYAAQDPYEDFAEAFVTYVQFGEEFRAMVEARGSKALKYKYDFLKNQIFEGKEFGVTGSVKLQAEVELAHVHSIAYDATKLHLVK